MEIEVIKEQDITQFKPEKVNRPFLREQGLIQRAISTIKRQEQTPIKEDLAEPVLLLMRDNGFTDVIENIKAGEFIMKSEIGEKSVILTPDKLTTLRYGNQYIKGWIAYENSATPYPENPLHTGEMLRKITMKLAMNWRDRDEAKLFEGKGKMWMFIIGAIAIAIVLIASSQGAKDFLFGATAKAAAQTAVDVVKQNITQATGGVVVS